MTKFTNHRFMRALARLPVDRTPVWIMRQAGRYLPEYRALRAKAGNFLTLCKTPDLACAATLLPIQKYGLDAAILFSDILLIPEAMGLGLEFVAEEGPVFGKTIQTLHDVENLKHIDPELELGFVSAAIKQIVVELGEKTPLIGFAGSPWTVSAYMIEGQTSKHFYKLKGMMYANPAILHKLLAHMATQITHALQAQINAGVAAVMLFDTWGGILNDAMFKEFSLYYMLQIVQRIKHSHPNTPIILFSKNGGRCLQEMAASGCQALGLDWTACLTTAKALVGKQVALQGNLDPCVLYAPAERIKSEVRSVLTQFGAGPGHIFNLGHGIPYDVSPESVYVMLEALHEYSPAFNQPVLTV